jgi:hypothetical protein
MKQIDLLRLVRSLGKWVAIKFYFKVNHKVYIFSAVAHFYSFKISPFKKIQLLW